MAPSSPEKPTDTDAAALATSGERPAAPEIGRRIYAIRKARHLTLCDVEKKSGLSISVLSQIERGKVNPTFNTLWQLTQSLQIDIADLVERSVTKTRLSEYIEVVSDSGTPTAESADGRCQIRIHTSQRQVLPVEWYEMTLAENAELHAEPRADRAWQHLTVSQGVIEILLGDDTKIVKAGESARFSTKLGHVLRNRQNRKARMFIVVVSSFELIGTGYAHYDLQRRQAVP